MLYGLIFTFIVGLFFLIGIFLLENSKNKEKLSIFTISLAFVVMLGLLIFDLLPELIETKNIYLFIPMVIGFLLLVFLDRLIPHHHHEHISDSSCDKKDHNMHLNHIGTLTIIALGIHNMIEGLSLYSVTINNISSGLLMMISISLHNIPLGFSIGNSLEKQKKNYFLILFLCLSATIGALIIILFGNLNEIVISNLLSLTFGMLLYILIFELLEEIIKNRKKKETIYGIIIGVMILIITNIF